PCRSHQAANSARDKSVISGCSGNESSATGKSAREKSGIGFAVCILGGQRPTCFPRQRKNEVAADEIRSTRQLTLTARQAHWSWRASGVSPMVLDSNSF